MILELNKDVVFVKGFLNGAIYILKTGEVYSINKKACEIISKLKENKKLTKEEKEYAELLKKNNLYNMECSIKSYIFEENVVNRYNTIWLEITQGCNMRCIHCYEGQTHKVSKRTLTLNEWKKIIDQLKILNIKRVIVIGGEPCIHENIYEILEYLGKKEIPTTLFTNASLLNNKIIDLLVRNDMEIKISLYGPNSEVHDKITKVKGSFNVLIKNIELLKEKGIVPTIAITLMKENEDYYLEIEKLLEKINIKKFKFDVIRKVFDGQQDKHYPENNKIRNLVKRTSPYFLVKKKTFNINVKKNSCWYGKLVISEDGSLFPCVFARNEILGNIKETNVKKLLESKKLSQLWNLNMDKIKICSDCEFRYACIDCRPLAYSEKKDLYEKNPRCLYNPYTGMWLND